jgi:hypothetical protein
MSDGLKSVQFFWKSYQKYFGQSETRVAILDIYSLQIGNMLLQNPWRNNCGRFGGWAFIGSEEEAENVKGLRPTDDGCRTLFDQKSSDALHMS